MKGFHHYYIGLFLILLAFLILIYANKDASLLFIIGFFIVIDDYYQHTKQLKIPEYRSPLNQLYGRTLWKFKPVQWLNKLMDKIFGA